MKFSTQQLLLIVISAALLTLSVLRFIFVGVAAFDAAACVGLILVALCGLYGAWKLEHTGSRRIGAILVPRRKVDASTTSSLTSLTDARSILYFDDSPHCKALLIFFIAMIIMLILDIALFITSLSYCRWNWCGNSLAYIIVTIVVEAFGAFLAHRLRHGHHSHVLLKI